MGHIEEHEKKKLHKICTDFMVDVAGGIEVGEPCRDVAANMLYRVSPLNHTMVKVFKAHGENCLFIIKLHLLGDVTKYMRRNPGMNL